MSGLSIAKRDESVASPHWRWAEHIVLLDFVLFALFTFDRVRTGPIPAGVAVATLVGFIAFTRRPKLRTRHLGLLMSGYAVMLLYLMAVSEITGVDWHQRLLRFALIGGIAWALAEGRMDAFSAVLGLATGLILNVPAYYLGLTPDNYPPFLTGFLGDKNISGLWYAALTIGGLLLWRRTSAKVAWVALAGGFVFLTGSRTSMSATLAAIIWIIMRNRLGIVLRLGLIGGIIWALNYAEQHLARIGMFAEREGTDWFRDRIAQAVNIKLQLTPWYGQGLGTAWVDLDHNDRFLFHDSFDALRVEGGWPLLVAWVAIIVLVVGGLFRTGPADQATRINEGLVVVLMVCAWQLGETFFTSIGFIVMGLALRARFGEPTDLPDAVQSGASPAPDPAHWRRV